VPPAATTEELTLTLKTRLTATAAKQTIAGEIEQQQWVESASSPMRTIGQEPSSID